MSDTEQVRRDAEHQARENRRLYIEQQTAWQHRQAAQAAYDAARRAAASRKT